MLTDVDGEMSSKAGDRWAGAATAASLPGGAYYQPARFEPSGIEKCRTIRLLEIGGLAGERKVDTRA